MSCTSMEGSITVVTINRNNAVGLKKTFDSISKQHFRDFEYVVIDGNSSDDSLSLIRNNDNIDKYISEKDDGIYDAMNKGIDVSSGRYILFLNSGDSLSDSQVLANIALKINNDVDVLYGDHFVAGSRRKRGLQKASSHSHYRKGMFACHQSMIFNRRCFVERKFSSDYGSAGDYEFILHLIVSEKKFQKCNFPIAIFEAGGLSDIARVGSLQNGIRALKANQLYDARASVLFFYMLMRAHFVWAINKLRRIHRRDLHASN